MTVRVEYRKMTSGNISPRLVITNNGKRSFEPIKIKIYKNDPEHKQKVQACEAIRARREFQIFGQSHHIAIKIDLDLQTIVNEYVDSLNIASKKKYVYAAKYINDYFDCSIQNLDQSMCQGFADYIYSQVSTNTAYSYYACFSRILQSCVERSIITINPARGVKRPSVKNLKAKEVLSFDEFNELLRHPINNKDIMRASILSFYSGIGLSEIIKLTPKNIQGNYLKYSRSKNGVPVSVELKPFVLNIVKKIPFESLPKTSEGVNKSLRQWIDKTSINKHITFYCFRHSFAVNLLLNDVNIKHVKELMGHTSLKHTMQYLHFVDMIKSRPTMKLPNLELGDVF